MTLEEGREFYTGIRGCPLTSSEETIGARNQNVLLRGTIDAQSRD